VLLYCCEMLYLYVCMYVVCMYDVCMYVCALRSFAAVYMELE